MNLTMMKIFNGNSLIITKSRRDGTLLTVGFNLRETRRAMPSAKTKQRILNVFLCLILLVLIIRIVQRRVVDVSMCPTDSMENAIMAGDRLVVSKTHEVIRGDVFVFNHPDGSVVQLVKRCIGLPGDTVQIVRSATYINGKISKAIPTVRKSSFDFSVDFPLPSLGWDINNFGPVVTPAKGLTIALDSANMNLYRTMIQAEGREVSCRDGVFYIDDSPATHYTFRSNGYFVLGDNRGNSLDSRYWGFVPENLVVGKVVMVYFSRDYRRREIRWERIGQKIE